MSNELWKRIPNWLLGVGLLSIAAVVAIQMIRGDALVCADGAILARQCDAPPTPIDVPEGAVIAFDGECPDGWDDVGLKDRKRFAGRVLIVAGPPAARSDNGSTSDRAFDAQGGEESVLLSEAHVPPHDHAPEGSKFPNLVGYTKTKTAKTTDTTDSGEFNLHASAKIRGFGGGEPHNNMPPYIALSFCRKAG